MNAKDACIILEALMDGIDPITGEMLPEDHVCHEPAVLRALHKAIVTLRNSDAVADDDAMVNQNGRLNAGRSWTQEDLEALKQLHEAGVSMDEMCDLLQRRRRGVERQLFYLGLVDGKDVRLAVNASRPRAGTPWTAVDDKTLRELWEQGRSEEQIAEQLQRTAYAIHCRMERFGMIEAEDTETVPSLRPWTLEDAQRLKRLHADGCTVEDMAEQMNRPIESIRGRMFAMGLSRESPVSLRAKEKGMDAYDDGI